LLRHVNTNDSGISSTYGMPSFSKLVHLLFQKHIASLSHPSLPQLYDGVTEGVQTNTGVADQRSYTVTTPQTVKFQGTWHTFCADNEIRTVVIH